MQVQHSLFPAPRPLYVFTSKHLSSFHLYVIFLPLTLDPQPRRQHCTHFFSGLPTLRLPPPLHPLPSSQKADLAMSHLCHQEVQEGKGYLGAKGASPLISSSQLAFLPHDQIAQKQVTKHFDSGVLPRQRYRFTFSIVPCDGFYEAT